MNRKYIGIDISQEYCDLSSQRIKNYKGEQKPQSYWDALFNPIEKNVHSPLDEFF